MPKVKVRYAPSPTGVPHIGNIRTALFNFLFAKSQKGEFILRIEDTDRKRLIPESVGKIKESLKALNLAWDGPEIYQSKRLNLYQKHLIILKQKKLAYQKEGAWYFKVSPTQKVSWQDLLHGSIEFNSNVIEDFVIVKSDSYPTYHFASVVDDHDMQISHVIRGDEWISSTPKHLLLYQSFDWKAPEFVHLPPILGESKKKLSKREGARSVLEYIDDGYLPEALINFLALLGWSPSPRVAGGEVGKRERELFTLNELIDEFSLDRLNKNSPIFNLEKLNWFNKKYIQKLSTEELVIKIKTFNRHLVIPAKAGIKQKRILDQVANDVKLSKIADLIRDRLVTLNDFDEVSRIFFEKGNQQPPPRLKIEMAQGAISSIKSWDYESIAKNLDQWITQNNLDSSDFKNTLRLSVFADNTPPIYESLAVLSKEEALSRIAGALKKSQ